MITLSHGAFTFVPGNDPAASYAWRNTTDLGALAVASVEGGFEFNASDTWYDSYGSFYLESINGTANEPYQPGISKSWSIFLNGNPAPQGLGLNRLQDEDIVSCYFCPTNAITWQPEIDNATYAVHITVDIPEPLTVFDGGVVLSIPGPFSFSPTNNPAEEYAVENASDLGALAAAADTGGFSIATSDEWFTLFGSFLLEGIDGITNEDWTIPNYKSWVIFVDGEPAPQGMGLNEVECGDVVSFYYCPSDPVSYEYFTDEATHIVTINVETRIDWIGDVTLEYGAFDFIPSNDPDAQYEIARVTDLGALDTAAESGGFSFEASDAWYASYGSFLLESIAGIANEDWMIPDAKSWALFINGAPASSGLGSNLLEDGDTVTFYYCPNDPVTYAPIPGQATSVVTINVQIPAFTSWTGSVSLPEGTFECVPANDPAARYDVHHGSDLGTLHAAAKKCGFDYNISDAWYDDYGSFLLEGIGGIENELWPGDTWYIHLNGELAPQGLGLTTVTTGDRVVFYYGPYDDPAHATHKLDVTVTDAPQGRSPGASEDDGPDEGTIKWSVELPESPDFAPVVADGRVYVATWPDMDFSDGDEMYLYCLDEQTGEEIWKNPLGTGYGSISGGVIANGNLYCGGTDGVVYCIDTSDGSTVWDTQVYSGSAGAGVSSKPLVYEGQVFVNTADGILFALDPATGAESWRFTSGGGFPAWGGTYFTSPAHAGNTIIYAGDESEVYCIDTQTHTKVWNFTTEGTIGSTPVVGNTMTSLTTTEKMYALNTANGVKIAETDINGNLGTPVLSGTALYLGTNDGFSRYDANSLEETWHVTCGPVSVSPALADNTVYFATNEETGTVYALDAGTGNEIWHYTVPSSGDGTWASFWASSPAISDSVLFIGAENNHFYAFGEGTVQPTVTPTPDSGGGDDDDPAVPPSRWRTVTLSTGTFEATGEDTGDHFDVNRQTALGILDAAGISYTINSQWWDEYGSLFITSVAGRRNDGLSGWMYQVNGASPGAGANAYSLNDGDEVVFYWSENMASSPETSDQAYYLKARIPTPDSSGGDDDDSIEHDTQGGETGSGTRYLLGLPEGATLTLAEFGEFFSIDIDAAISAGESIIQDGNIISFTRNNITMNIRLEDFEERNGVTSGIIESIWIESEPASSQIQSTGTVSASFEAELHTLPVDALVTGTITDTIPEETSEAFMLAAERDGHQIADIAYVFSVDTGTLEDGIDIGTATLTMTVSREWIEAHGGIDAVRIAHLKEDGSVEMLEIAFEGYDDEGYATFSAVSPAGLSSFALITLIEMPDTLAIPDAEETQEVQDNEAAATSIATSGDAFPSGMLLIGGGCALIIALIAFVFRRRT
jgi:outer membrane protein assembly factor BamB